MTVAHRGDDARIVHREARSLLEAGHQVTLIAPRPPPESLDRDPAGLIRIDVPRARRWRRPGAWIAARRAMRKLRREPSVPSVDLVVIHDPELVPLFVRRRAPAPVVWDVHEDFVASIPDRRYLPRMLRPLVVRVVAGLERWALQRCKLVVAEEAYARRLGPHPVVPNGTWVPDLPTGLATDQDPNQNTDPDTAPQVVYIGRLSTARGVREIIEIGRRLHPTVTVEVIGDADPEVRAELSAANAEGIIRWEGYLSNPAALARLDGAFAGLSLLHAEPNYLHSMPTKLIEYLAHGVPVIATPLPPATALVAASGGGELTRSATEPASIIDDVVEIVHRWRSDPNEHRDRARRGHAYVREHHAWQHDGDRFVALLERWAAEPD